ncbi:MAG: heavy metal translocating P-type ATPase [Byssovorax sp.]
MTDTPARLAFVVHAIPGRVRLRVARLDEDAGYGAALEATLRRLPGVSAVRVAAGAASVIVEHDPEAVDVAAITWAAAAAAEDAAPLAVTVASAEGTGIPRALYWSSAGLLVSLSFGHVLPLVAYPFIAVTAVPVFKRAWSALVHRRKLNVDLLDALAILAATATGDVLNAAGIVWLICVGDHIRDLTQARARRAIRDLLEYEHDLAWVVRGETKVQVPVAELVVGDVVVVYTGAAIAVDGVVTQGRAVVDQQALTGESLPVVKVTDDHVFAATVVSDGKLYVRAERVGRDTKAASTVRLIEDAPVAETRIQNHAEMVADRLVAPALGCAALVFFATADMNRLAAILTVDFGTGPRVSAPTTVLASMNAAARHGILIKGGAYLEKLARVSTVIFDKTGTLTRGVPEVTDVLVHDALSDREAATLAASAAARQTHPVSQAVIRLAATWGLEVPERDSSSYFVGKGIESQVRGRTVQLGSQRFLAEQGITSRLDPQHRSALDDAAKSLLFLAVDGAHAATLAYRDEIRAESRDLIRDLRARGVDDIVMLTGDGHAVARHVAGELGIDRFFAEMLPEDKAEMAQRFRREGRVVAVVGDGINESPALSYADIGVSVCAGAEIARETAGMVLMTADLHKLVEAIDISRSAISIMRQNHALSFGVNSLCYALSIPGLISPVVATLISNGSAVLACLNGLRPLLSTRTPRSWSAEQVEKRDV